MFTPKIILAGVLFGVFVFNLSWKNCVKLCLFLVVIEGAIRKWVFPGASELVYFVKDAVIIVAYLKFYTSKSVKLHGLNIVNDQTMKFFLVCSTAIILLQVFNIHSGSPIIGIIGARNYLLYIPLMFICSELFENQEELARYLRRYLLLTFPICMLAVYQNQMPADHWINRFVGASVTSQGYIGTSVRVTGTFSYIAGYAAYLMTCASLVLPLLIVHHPKRWKFTFLVVISSVVTGIMLTGSRGPMIGLALFIFGYFAFNRTFRQLGLYKRLIVPLALVGAVSIYWFNTLLHEYISRFSATGDIGHRVNSIFNSPMDYLQYSGIIGYGVGATYQAIPRIRQLFSLPYGTYIPIFYESEPERIMLEIGPLGFLFWYALRIVIIAGLWRTHRRLTMPLFRELALTAFLLHLVSLPGQVVFQVTVTVYYWFTAGFIFLLPRLEALEAFRDPVPQPEDNHTQDTVTNKQQWDESSSHIH